MKALRATLVALGAAVVTAACAAGQQAQTADEQPSLDGTQGKIGNIQLEGVSFRPPSGSSYATGAEVPLIVYLVNNGKQTDALVNVSGPAFTGGWDVVNAPPAVSSPTAGATTPTATSSGSPQTITPGNAVGFGFQNLDPNGATSEETIVLKGLTKALYPGNAVRVTFTFARAGSTTLSVPVKVSTEPDTQTLPGGESGAEG